jgi:hypothetical protein
MTGILLNEVGDVIIQEHGYIKTVKGLCPIRKHYWNRANHLHLSVVFLVFLYSDVGIPGIVFDLAKKLISTHHFGKAAFVMLYEDEVAIPVFVAPVRKLFWKNVRVAIDFKHEVAREVDATS